MFTKNIKDTFTANLLNAVSGVLGEAKKKQCSEGCECEACVPEEETNENYVSHAQRKAVWANRADDGKGHPDKKKKMKEEVDVEEMVNEAADGLADKAKKSGVSLSVLRKVYARGIAAWNTGHRPGTTPQQWAHARVNSYIAKGKGTYGGADKDLRSEGTIPTNDMPSDRDRKVAGKLGALLKREREAKEKKEPNGVKESNDDVPFEGPYRKAGERKDEYGNKVKNVAKHLAKKAMKANEEVEELEENWSPVNTGAGKKQFTQTSLRYKKKAEDHLSSAKGRVGGADSPMGRSDMAKHHAAMADHIKNSFIAGSARYSNMTDAKQEYNKHKALAKQYKSNVNEEVEQIDEDHQYVEITNAHTNSKSYIPVHKTQAFAALNHYRSFSHNKGVRIIDKKQHDAIQAAKTPWNPSGESHSPFHEELEEAWVVKKGTEVVSSHKSKDEADVKAMKNPMYKVYAKEEAEIEEAVGDITVKKLSPDEAFKKHTGQMTKKTSVPKDPKTGKTLYQKVTSEEVEQIDELSKATMGRYINKAATKMGSQGVTAGLKIAADEKSNKQFKDMGKREKGIKLAVNKLTKEEQEFIDALNADTLDEARGRPKKAGAKDFTVNPKTKEKLMHDNPAHMKKIELLQKNGVLPKPKTEANQNIMTQLQRAKTSMTGGTTIHFTHGDSKEVSGTHAAKLLDKHAGMKPNEKEAFQKKIGHSHANLKSEL